MCVNTAMHRTIIQLLFFKGVNICEVLLLAFQCTNSVLIFNVHVQLVHIGLPGMGPLYTQRLRSLCSCTPQVTDSGNAGVGRNSVTSEATAIQEIEMSHYFQVPSNNPGEDDSLRAVSTVLVFVYKLPRNVRVAAAPVV